MGVWHPPPSFRRKARSACVVMRVPSWSSFPDLLRNFLFILPYFNRDHTLSDSRADLLRREIFRNAILESQPVDAGRGHHQRVTVSPFDFLQARVQVAAKVGEFSSQDEGPATGIAAAGCWCRSWRCGEVRKTADCHG